MVSRNFQYSDIYSRKEIVNELYNQLKMSEKYINHKINMRNGVWGGKAVNTGPNNFIVNAR